MRYHFRIHSEDDGYWAECIELDGCMTQGNDMTELMLNAREALDLYLSEPEDSSVVFPKPKKRVSGKNILRVCPSPSVALSTLLKQSRKSKGYTQKQVAEKLGFRSIFAYQKLESPKTCNPELYTLAKLKKIFPNIVMDDVIEVD